MIGHPGSAIGSISRGRNRDGQFDQSPHVPREQRDLAIPSRPHTLRVLVDEKSKELGVEPKVVFEVDSVTAMKELALTGVAGLVMAMGAVRTELADGRLKARRVVEPDLSRQLYLVQSNRRPPSKAVQALSTLMRDTVADFSQRSDVGWRALQSV